MCVPWVPLGALYVLFREVSSGLYPLCHWVVSVLRRRSSLETVLCRLPTAMLRVFFVQKTRLTGMSELTACISSSFMVF